MNGSLIFMTLLSAIQSGPERTDTGQLELSTDRIMVFKDGYALFVKTAVGTADEEGHLYTEDVPGGVILGSFWAASTSGPKVRSIRAHRVTRTVEHASPSKAADLGAVLRENQGKTVTLFLREGKLAGRVVDVLLGNGWVVFESGDTQHLIRVDDIQSLTGEKLDTETTIRTTSTEEAKRLTFDLGPSAKGKRVQMSILYFREGLRWIPTYRLEDATKTEGRLSLQGELLNEAESIYDAQVNLVVGVPSFQFKDTPSPLTLEQTLRNVLKRAAPALMGQMGSLSNGMFAQRASESVGDFGPASRPASESAEVEHGDSGDLFVYPAGRHTLETGSRIAIALWEKTVQLSHVYTLSASIDEPNNYTAVPGNTPLRILDNQFWHQVEIENPKKSGIPLTTGPILLLDGPLPLGQSILTFTPEGARTEVPVTVATFLRSAYDEEETEREPNAARVNGRTYTRVASKGTFRIEHHGKTPAKIRVELTGRGRVRADGAKVSAQSLGSGVEPSSAVIIEKTLRPGARYELQLQRERLM